MVASDFRMLEYVSAELNHQQQTAVDRSRQQLAAAHSSKQQQAATRQFQNSVCSLLEIRFPHQQCASLRRQIGAKQKQGIVLGQILQARFVWRCNLSTLQRIASKKLVSTAR